MNNMRNKILMTLALLLMAVTGTWAQDVSWTFAQVHDVVGDEITAGETYTSDGISMTFVKNDDYHSCSFTSGSISITGGGGCLQFTAPEGKQFSKIVINSSATGNNQSFCSWNPGYVDGVYSTTWVGDEPASVVTTSPVGSGWDFFVYNPTGFEFYFANALTVEWDAATKTGTFEMPAFDVELTPVYAPAAKWATDGDKILAPTAAEGVIAGTEDAIVKAGTVVEGQGTVMYFATTDAEMTAEKAAEAEGWLSTLPTAAGYDDATTVYVWYYIKGADTPQGETPTAENTFNDLEICTTPIEVTLLSNKFDIQFNAANANTIEAGKATVKVGETAAEVKEGKLTGVKMDSKVTITAKDGYKFRKAEGKKGIVKLLYIEASNHKLYYMEGETWRQAINNHTDLNQGWQYGGMEVWFGNIVNVLKGNGAAVDPGSVIDPTKTYTL